MSTALRDSAKKTLSNQSSEALASKLKNGKLMGVSYDAAIEILTERKSKGKYEGEIPANSNGHASTSKKSSEAKEPKAKKEKVAKEPKVKKEKVVKEKVLKVWEVNGKKYTKGDKVEMEAAANSSLKGKKITGELIGAFADPDDKATVIKIKSSQGKTMMTKKLDKIKFVK